MRNLEPELLAIDPHDLTKPAIAWVIEKRGHPPILTHYADVAKKAQDNGLFVTPYHSKVI